MVLRKDAKSEPKSLHRPGMTVQNESERRQANRAAKTFPGMMDFANDTSGHTCRECAAFLPDANQRRGECSKFVDRMRPKRALRFPAHANACKYFELKKAPG
jgi:hypothetical protein